MKRWKIWTAFLSVFAVGVLVGVVGVGVFLKHHFSMPSDPETFRESMKTRIVEKIVDRVEPDAAALPEIEAIVDDVVTDMDAVRSEAFPKIKATLERARTRLEQTLTPEQMERFDEMIEERRQGRFGLLQLPPPPPPMP